MEWTEVHELAAPPGAALPTYAATATAADGATLRVLVYGERPGARSRILRPGPQDQKGARWFLICDNRVPTHYEMRSATAHAAHHSPEWWAIPGAWRCDSDAPPDPLEESPEGYAIGGEFAGPIPPGMGLIVGYGAVPMDPRLQGANADA